MIDLEAVAKITLLLHAEERLAATFCREKALFFTNGMATATYLTLYMGLKTFPLQRLVYFPFLPSASVTS
jgi:hypothetical protein